MSRSSSRGRHEVGALVIEVWLIGETASRERVLDLWSEGSRLLELADGRWLLVLGRSVWLESEFAPGLPVPIGADGTVQFTWHGRVLTIRPDELPEVPVTDWFDLSGLRSERLHPVELPVTTVVPEAVEPLPDPNPRRWARVEKSRDQERIARELSGSGAGRFDWLLRRLPIPAGLSRRQQRYLASLIEQFEHQEYETALRRAISLSGGAGRALLRLPVPRTGALRPGGPSTGGAGVSVGNLEGRLRALYAQAAAKLEAQGRIEEAAFVHADLLGAVRDAVNLLERHERFGPAAELAAAHQLPADLVVRLWWRAGNRDRAIRHALARGAFATAIASLRLVDPVAARTLRIAWIEACQAVGDHLAAVHAAWPSPSLRDRVLADVQAGMVLGGTVSGELLALMVTHRPTSGALDLAAALLTTSDPGLTAARRRYVLTLSQQEASDPAADRRLATDAARSAVRDGTLTGLGPGELAKHWQALIGRADPLAVADLPRPKSRRPGPGENLDVVGLEPSGLGVLDAVPLSGGTLVALGPLGVRLLAPDGRVRARWGIPTDGFVVADHGGMVLLLNRGEQITDLHRLDLATRQARPWCTLSLRQVLPSYDGSVLIAQDGDGLVWLDTSTARPRVLWREFTASTAIRELARSPDQLLALVSDPSAPKGRPEWWRWSLPDVLLRSRKTSEGNGKDPSDDSSYEIYPSADEVWTITSAGADQVLERVRRQGVSGVRVSLPESTTGTAIDLAGVRIHAGRFVVFDSGGRVISGELSGPASVVNLVVRADR